MVPAAFSATLSDGSVVSGLFTPPTGVDAHQASQSLALTDLTVVSGGVTYTAGDFQSTPTTDYEYGVFVGITGTTTDGALSLNDAQITAGSDSGSVTYDTAETELTFDLPDGSSGAISYNIPWDQVDSAQTSQSLSLSNFNLNIAGQNFNESNATFTTSPTIEITNGVFQGVTFAMNLPSGAGLPYSALSMSGLVITATLANGEGDCQAQAKNKVTALSLDFKDVSNSFTYDLTIQVRLSDGTTKSVTITIEEGTTAGGTRDAVYLAIKELGFSAELSGDNRLIVKGTDQANLSSITLSAPKDSASGTNPGINKVTTALKLGNGDFTPVLIINIK